ncbi:MAG: serpin family protein [Porphyromonadaceae bacterium]|nr:MAG: serpin family protein [Porphyromonadaceae bacterium]
MKTLERFLVVMVMVVMIASCSKDKDYETKPLNLPLKAAGVITADNTFGLDLYTKLAGAAVSGTNLMISPLSVSQALSMTYNGANGDTKTAMEEALRIAGYDRDELNQLNKTLVTALVAHDAKVIISIANSIWYRKEYTVLPDFITRNQTYYDAEIRPMDFTASDCKTVINNWVSDKTNKKITEIVDQINPESFMFLINAIYFKGAWTYAFDKKDTYQQPFYLEDGKEVQVDMMHQEMDLNMFANETFTSVELPYGKGNWRMFLFLPETGKTVSDVEKNFTPENWNSWLNRYDTISEVQFSLPKFTFSYEESLKDALSAMGMEIAFTDKADFTGILPEGGLLITGVKHKTFIEVNEEGTEAAAVTSVEIGLTSIGNFITFNKPFLFAIAEKSTGAILFIGRMMKPE